MPSSRVLSLLVFVFVTLLSSVLSAPVAISEVADTDSMKRVAPTPNSGSGQGTWFYPGENACGSVSPTSLSYLNNCLNVSSKPQWDNNNSEIVAVSSEIFNDGKNCWRVSSIPRWLQ